MSLTAEKETNLLVARNLHSAIRICLLAIVLALTNESRVSSQDPFSLPRLMDQYPKFVQVEPKAALSNKLVPMWVKALDSKNVSLQRKAADSVVIAKKLGLGPLDDIHAPLLEKIAEEKLDSLVRISVAKAIVSLQLKEAAKKFLALMNMNKDIRLNSVLQPALADWKLEDAKELWQKALTSDLSRIRDRVWAINGLSAISDVSIVGKLKEWVLDASEDYRIRTASARQLGRLLESGLTDVAEKLQKSSTVVDRILAAELLRNPGEPRDLEISLLLAEDADSAVCTLMWSNLVKSTNARQLDKLIEFGLKHREPKVRRAATELLRLWKSPDACKKLGVMLADLHPEVRNNAREILLEFSGGNNLKTEVIEAAIGRLNSNWQGIQQALLILTELDVKPSASKMVKLLEHDRGEVHVTAGWSLERLSVPETLEPVCRFVEKRVTRIKSGGASEFGESEFESLSHAIQLLGKNKYREMEKVIIPRLLPKDMSILEYPIRPAAVWSIGKIYQGKTLPEDLKAKLVARLMDDDANNPEHSYVKSMCTFVFAVTDSKDTIPNIEKYADKTGSISRFGFYCSWSLNQLDGRPLKVVEQFIRNDNDWFLSPID